MSKMEKKKKKDKQIISLLLEIIWEWEIIELLLIQVWLIVPSASMEEKAMNESRLSSISTFSLFFFR